MKTLSCALFGCSLLLSLAGCSSDSCTEMGCTSAGLILGEMGTPSGTVTLEACRNGACTRLESVPAEGCQSAGSAPQIYVCFAPITTGVRFDVTVYHAGEGEPLTDGDLYTLAVTEDTSSSALVQFSGAASYEEYRPNGDGCAPVCKSAELRL